MKAWSFCSASILILLFSMPMAASGPPRVEPSPELERLHFQLGQWHVTSQKLDKDGGVAETRHYRVETTLEHRGLLLLSMSYFEGLDMPGMRVWQFFDRYDGMLHDVSFDMVGHFEHRIEGTNDGSLAFAFPEKRAFQDGVPRNWRKTYTDIAEDSYRLSWDYTEDDSTWTPFFRAHFERVRP